MNRWDGFHEPGHSSGCMTLWGLSEGRLVGRE